MPIFASSESTLLGMIFYFSGTGNTRWVASEIAKAINEELFYIPDLIREERSEFTLHDGERIGFCFPTHGWQVPRIVREFIKRLKMNTKDHYCWALTTCGDDMGETMTILNRDLAANELLANNGVPLQADTTFSVIMPESYVCLPFMKTDPELRQVRESLSCGQYKRCTARVDSQRTVHFMSGLLSLLSCACHQLRQDYKEARPILLQ